MAGYDDGEDFFDDDDLDALPHDTLLELENNAIQFTQAQTQAARQKPPPSSDYGDEFDDEDLDDAVVIDESRSTAAIPPLQRPDPVTQHEQFRQERYGAPSGSNLGNRPRQLHQPSRVSAQIPTPQHESMVAQQGSHSSAAADLTVESLQKQVEQLINERNALRDEVNAKTGEIAIVRSKQDKTVKEYEREMIAVRKLNEDKLAKQQKALEAARISEKNAATERDFIRRDLAEESERVRRLNRAREAEKKDGGNLTTPKKKKTLPHADGFESDECQILSPSKLSPSKFQRRVTGSPAKPGKRKRKAIESPAGPLEVIQPEPVVEAEQKPILDEAIFARLTIQDDRFDFIGTMLDHRIDANHLRTLEELGKYALPSLPKESFQSKILGKIPEMGMKVPSKDLPIDFCELLISMWQSCVEEKYLTPIYLFIDLLSFALEMKTSAIAPHIVDYLVPIAQRTVDLVAIPRYKSTTTMPWERDVDVSACMSLLHLTALGCMSDPEYITRFWKYMRWDFVIIMLSTNQVRADYSTMLRLLSTSVLKDSFGTIQGENQDVQAGYTIDRLIYPLTEVPLIPLTQDKVAAEDIAQMRIEVLRLIIGMTRSPYASRALALHPNAIGHLVCLLSDELDTLYDFTSGHELSARIVSMSIRLLNHLVIKHDNIIDMQRKLSVIHGGNQKFLLSLSRLNFSEDDLVLESGLDPDVATCALELLELSVTPEEGEAIQAAFSSQ